MYIHEYRGKSAFEIHYYIISDNIALSDQCPASKNIKKHESDLHHVMAFDQLQVLATV